MSFAIMALDDLGSMASSLECHGLTREDVSAWLDHHEDVGTFVILDEEDGEPACGHLWGLAGGAVACECGRIDCPDSMPPEKLSDLWEAYLAADTEDLRLLTWRAWFRALCSGRYSAEDT